MRIDHQQRLLRLVSIGSQLAPQLQEAQSWGADLLALRLLAQHRIGDPEWIAGWLEFKKEYHEQRLADVVGILAILEGKGPS